MVILTISMAIFTFTGTLAAFGGDTTIKGTKPLQQRITNRGWLSLVCLVITFALGIVKELETAAHTRQEAEERAKLEAERDKMERENHERLAELSRQVLKIREAAEGAAKIGVPTAPVSAEVTGTRALLGEALNVAVSIAISGEEMFTKGKFNEALLRFQQADKVAEVAAIKARIADTYLRLGDYASAIEYERAAIALAPNWSGPPYVLAFSLVHEGKRSEALPPAERSCELGFEVACRLADEIRTAQK